MRWRWPLLLLLPACGVPVEADPYEPPRITVEQSGEVTIYTDSLVGVLCYRVGGSLSCVSPSVVVDTVESWE
jgi:hypothetical protein